MRDGRGIGGDWMAVGRVGGDSMRTREVRTKGAARILLKKVVELRTKLATAAPERWSGGDADGYTWRSWPDEPVGVVGMDGKMGSSGRPGRTQIASTKVEVSRRAPAGDRKMARMKGMGMGKCVEAARC